MGDNHEEPRDHHENWICEDPEQGTPGTRGSRIARVPGSGGTGCRLIRQEWRNKGGGDGADMADWSALSGVSTGIDISCISVLG